MSGFAEVSYGSTRATDFDVAADGTIVELKPEEPMTRQALEVINCTSGNVRLFQTEDQTMTVDGAGSTPSAADYLSTDAFDHVMAVGAPPKYYGARRNIRIFAMSDAAGKVRLREYA